MEELEAQGLQAHSRHDLAAFIENLADSLVEEPENWENDNLERFLRAWSAWLRDLEGYFANRGQPVPKDPTWQLVAQMLLAARVYE